MFCIHCGEEATGQFCRQCGNPTGQLNGSGHRQIAVPALKKGASLDSRYVLEKALGQGGMGEVWEAYDRRLQMAPVAVKRLIPSGSLTEQQEQKHMFQQEAVILAGLQHEGIPRVRDFFVDGTGCYLIMDLIEGNTLDECFKFNSLYSYLNIMVIGKEIAGILAYLHRRQIVFRDLKPSNIIKRSEDRKLFLIDFGISRLFKPGQAKDTATFGSAGYAAPEQHGAAQTDGRSDIYSLGATLYALFTGDDMANHPFRFDYDQIGHTQLREYIKQMTSIDREQRPASALDVQLEFQRMITKMAEPFPGTAKSIQS